MKVQDKVAIVTGGAQGLGRGTSLVLAENGADIVVADINLAGAENVAKEVAETGRKSLAVYVDVSNRESVNQMVDKVLAHFGKIDILVNNAGLIGAEGWETRQEETDEDWEALFAVNIRGIILTIDAVVPHMKEKHYGKIINISSGAGRQGGAGGQSYGVSKAGVINITQGKAHELGPFNINVNCICPGWIWTPMCELIEIRGGSSPDPTTGKIQRVWFDGVVENRIPMGREQTAEDIGYAVAFLASDYSENITGQSINVDGGGYMN
jgi:NAD(P)-dependent dehydrogenase (short-subunit alcohol dehydrogenase family)